MQHFDLFFYLALHLKYGGQRCNGRIIKPFFFQLKANLFQADLVKLVNSNGDIGKLAGSPDCFCNTGKDLAVVEKCSGLNAQAKEHLVDDLQKFHFIEKGWTSDHIHITLEKFPVAAFLRTVGTPNRLDLVAFKGKNQFVLMLHHETGKGNSEIVAETFFRDMSCERCKIRDAGCSGLNRVPCILHPASRILHPIQVISRIQNLEQEPVTFFPVFSHQG